MNSKRTSSGRFFWISAAILFALALFVSTCETKKEFDYWQYVEWENPNSPDDDMDHDAGADGGEVDDMDGGMGG